MTTSEKTDVFDSVIDSLAHLIGGNDGRTGTIWPKAKVDQFDGFDVMDPRLPDADDDYILLGANVSDAPVWPMDARWGFYKEDEKGWIFKKVVTLDKKAWRGKLRLSSPRMYEHHELLTKHDGTSVGSITALASFGDKIAFAVNNPHYMGMHSARVPSGESEKLDIISAHGIALRREYLWSVLLGQPGIPRARFVTDPAGVREAFRLRDIPPGRERRAALRHWVRDHWRKRRQSEADRAWVKAHLRGATEFAWNGLSCAIHPSLEDLRKVSDT